jgi:hypothetical protein
MRQLKQCSTWENTLGAHRVATAVKVCIVFCEILEGWGRGAGGGAAHIYGGLQVVAGGTAGDEVDVERGLENPSLFKEGSARGGAC